MKFVIYIIHSNEPRWGLNSEVYENTVQLNKTANEM